MKTIILILSTILLFPGCIKTEIIGNPLEEKVDTVMTKKPHKPLPERDTTEHKDTGRVPIGFDAIVEDWEEINVN